MYAHFVFGNFLENSQEYEIWMQHLHEAIEKSEGTPNSLKHTLNITQSGAEKLGISVRRKFYENSFLEKKKKSSKN
jgi:hypothetical protein